MSDFPAVIIPPASSPSAGGTSSDGTQINGSILIPVTAIIIGLFVAGFIVVFRRRIFNVFRRCFGLPLVPSPTTLGSAENGQAAGGQLSAEQLAGTAPARTTGNGGTGTTATAVRGRRARRGVRRTDSGQSIRTLPAYSKEAGDEELVLVRRQSMRSVDEQEEGEDDVGLEEGEAGDDGTIEMRERRTSGVGGVLDRVASLRRSGSLRSIASAVSRRSSRGPTVEASAPPAEEADIAESGYPPSTPQTAPPARVRQASQTGSVRRGWGEAPTYLEAMSSPSPADSNPPSHPSDPGPSRTTLRERTSSTFRGLLSRTGLVPAPTSTYSGPLGLRTRSPPSTTYGRRPTSSVSLLLQPQTSRHSSSLSPDPTTSAYPSPWTSTHSLGLISSPIPHSAVRASFETTDLPRAGLSDDQMRFLGTREATSLAGVRVGEVPVAKRRRGSGAVPGPRNVSGGSTLSGGSSGEVGQEGEEGPPTWGEVDEERRQGEAAHGRVEASADVVGVGNISGEGGGGERSPARGHEDASSPATIPVRSTHTPPVLPGSPSTSDNTPPPPLPRLDIVAATPTTPTFPSRFPVIPPPVLGM
ncbi:uncharacterized protein MKK02DRAFT_41709 [Dioszegia hungarica]|uniref:Uncharacterized protein n=1 Tax=Dioszegia hungarica TaxID=4972 RepID=A0AA38H472_9TREE|nr:uncharacterized protein MKK02DRAFT_41709 [Dioszegia hungarica]KAI9632064.1 hypothetical protein MKK02DRAFT_41709 [Dioszegia hungarica]